MTSPRSHSQSGHSYVWSPGSLTLFLRVSLSAAFQVGIKGVEVLFVLFPQVLALLLPLPGSAVPSSPTPHPGPHPCSSVDTSLPPNIPVLLILPTHAAGPVEMGAGTPLRAPPGRTHHGRGAAHCSYCCHCHQRPRQEPPHAWRSVAKASTEQPRGSGHLSGELGRD